ncbi:hypothetical protein AAG570_011285 [Ranatra chinensis]|uniref:DNA repair protein RAD51 homolog 3 n=1 Tax=Ranatra chinensis TaxID=642074 RepID=A0ABD0YKB2_9HEMI
MAAVSRRPRVVWSGLAQRCIWLPFRDLAPKVLEILESHGYGGGFIEDMLNPPPSISAAQALVLESLGETIPSFSEALDEILGGGVALGKLIQVCGSPGSGKTQFVLQLCVDVQIPNVIEGLEGEAVIIDTECSFTVSRFREIADGVVRHCRRLAEANNITESIENFTVDSVLNGVHYTSATSFEKFTSLVHCLKSFLETHPRVKLIVIDSFVFPFLSMTNTLERTRRACVIINKLCDLARKHLIAAMRL